MLTKPPRVPPEFATDSHVSNPRPFVSVGFLRCVSAVLITAVTARLLLSPSFEFPDTMAGRLRELERISQKLPVVPRDWLVAAARLQCEIEELQQESPTQESQTLMDQHQRSLLEIETRIEEFRHRRAELRKQSTLLGRRIRVAELETETQETSLTPQLSRAEILASELDRATKRHRAETDLIRRYESELGRPSPVAPTPDSIRGIWESFRETAWSLSVEEFGRKILLAAGTLIWWLVDVAIVVQIDRGTNGYWRRFVVGCGTFIGTLGTIWLFFP